MHQAAELYDRVIREIQNWVPSQEYDHESKFQNELLDVLDERLNDGEIGPFGQNRDIPIYRERGRSNADLSVADVVGIEMKRNLTNGQAKKLRGQIEAYLDNYNFVVIVACGIRDTSSWRELKNRYERQGGARNGHVKFIWKKRENYGSDTNRSQQREQDTPDHGGPKTSVISENPAINPDAFYQDPDEFFQDPDDHNPFL